MKKHKKELFIALVALQRRLLAELLYPNICEALRMKRQTWSS